MNLSRLEREKRELCEAILSKKVEEKYEELKLDYVDDFLVENNMKADFKLFSLLNEQGLASGVGKCSSCASKFQDKVKLR